MGYSIQIETDNDAFYPDPGPELARILRKLADRLEGGDLAESVRLMDYNGNAVGRAEYAESGEAEE